MSKEKGQEQILNWLPRFKKVNRDFVIMYNNIDEYLEKCNNCEGLHFTDKAIDILLENSTWITKLGYKLGLVKF